MHGKGSEREERLLESSFVGLLKFPELLMSCTRRGKSVNRILGDLLEKNPPTKAINASERRCKLFRQTSISLFHMIC